MKEEEFKKLSDKDKKEVLYLMNFMKKFKEQKRNKELYATYEEYMCLVHISEDLINKLEKAESKLNKIKEYVKENIRLEYRNGRNNEFYLELNENKLNELLKIINEVDL